MNDIIDIGTLKGKNAEILTRRASAERELARLDEQARLLEQIELETASLVAYCQRVRDNLTRFDDDEKRLALDALQIIVYWHSDTPIEITGSIPVSIASAASAAEYAWGKRLVCGWTSPTWLRSRRPAANCHAESPGRRECALGGAASARACVSHTTRRADKEW